MHSIFKNRNFLEISGYLLSPIIYEYILLAIVDRSNNKKKERYKIQLKLNGIQI